MESIIHFGRATKLMLLGPLRPSHGLSTLTSEFALQPGLASVIAHSLTAGHRGGPRNTWSSGL